MATGNSKKAVLVKQVGNLPSPLYTEEQFILKAKRTLSQKEVERRMNKWLGK